MNPAERVPLGKTALTVSRLAVGTVPIGGMFATVDEDTAQATLRRAYDLGVRYFDTAPLYGHGARGATARHVYFFAGSERDSVVDEGWAASAHRAPTRLCRV